MSEDIDENQQPKQVTTSPKVSRWTRLRRTLLISLLIILLLICVIIAAPFIPFTRDLIRSVAVEQVSEILSGDINIGQLERFSWFGITAKDLAIRDKRGNLVATIDYFDADWKLLPLINGRVDVDQATIKGVTAIIRTYEDGNLNVTEIAKPSEDKPPTPPSKWLIKLKNIDLENGRVLWWDDTKLGAAPKKIGNFDRYALTTVHKEATNFSDHGFAVFDVNNLNLKAEYSIDLSGDMYGELKSLSGGIAMNMLRKNTELTVSKLAYRMRGQTHIADAKSLTLTNTLSLENLLLYADLAKSQAHPESGIPDNAVVTAAKMTVTPNATKLVVKDPLLAATVSGPIKAAIVNGKASAYLDVAVPNEGTLKLGAIINDVHDTEKTPWRVGLLARNMHPNRWSPKADVVKRVNANIYAEGLGLSKDASVTAHVQAKNSTVDKYAINDLDLHAKWKDELGEVKSLVLDTPYASAEGDAKFAIKTGDFEVNLFAAPHKKLTDLKTDDFKIREPGRGHVTVAAKGRLNLKAVHPLEYIEEIDAHTTVNLQSFSAENIHVGFINGNVKLKLKNIGEAKPLGQPKKKHLVLDADIVGTKLAYAPHRVGTIDFKSDVDTIINYPPTDLKDFLARLNSKVALKATNVHTSGLSVKKADVALNAKAKSNSAFDYNLKLDIDGFVSGTTRIAAANGNLDGNLDLKGGGGIGMIRSIETAGDLSVQGVKIPKKLSVQKGVVKLDVKGSPLDLHGGIAAAATNVVASDYEFSKVAAGIDLKGKRRFEVEIDGKQPNKTPHDFHTELKGKYRKNFGGVDFDNFKIKSDGENWTWTGTANIDAKKGNYSFDNAKLENGKQFLAIDGHFKMNKDQDITVEAKNLDIQSLRKTAGLTPGPNEPKISAKIDADLDIKGTAKTPNGYFNIYVRDVMIDEYGPFLIHLQGNYIEGLATILDASVSGYGQRFIAITGNFPALVHMNAQPELLPKKPIHGRISIPGVEIKRLRPILPILDEMQMSGLINLTAIVGGTLENLAVNVETEAEKIAATGVLSDNDIHIGPYSFKSKTSYSPKTDVKSAKFHTEGTLLEDFKHQAREARTSNQPDLQGSKSVAEVAKEDVISNEVLKFDLDLNVDVRKWIEDVVKGETIDWTSRILSTTYDLDLALKNFELRYLGLAQLRNAATVGDISAKINGSGKLSKPNLDIFFDIKHFGWERYRELNAKLDLRVHNGKISLPELNVIWDGDPILRGRGELPLPIEYIFGNRKWKDMNFDLALELSRIPISKLQAINYDFASYKGSMGASLILGGKLSDPTLQMRASLLETKFMNGEDGSVVMELKALENRVNFQTQVCHRGDICADLQASIPLNLNILGIIKGEKLAIPGKIGGHLYVQPEEIDSFIPANILNGIASELKGRLAANVEVGGTIDKPTLDGKLQFVNGNILLDKFQREFTQANLDMSFHEDGAEIKELSVRDGAGSLKAAGKLEMDQFSPRSLKFSVEAKKLSTAGFAKPLIVDGNIDLTGKFEGPTFNGDLKLSKFNIVIPETDEADAFATELSSDVIIVDKSEDDEVGGKFDATRAAEMFTVRNADVPFVNLKISLDKDTWVRHPIGKVNLFGDLQLQLKIAGISINGEIETLSGEFELLNRDFKIARCVVDFTGATPPNPRIDVVAHYLLDPKITEDVGIASSGKPKVIVTVAGTPSTIALKLTSDPTMPEDDIIYVLMTNRPPENSNVGEREGVANTAMNAASNIFAGFLQKKLQETIPVDTLRVDTGDGGFSDYRVEAGKYLTDNLLLSLSYQFGAKPDENNTTIGIEYQFAPDWTLKLEAGDRAKGGAAILWDIY